MRKGIILVLMLVLLSMSFGSVDAANSQGYEWGIDVGDRIDYRITYSQPSITTDPTGAYDFYATVVSLPTIPEPVSSYFEITIGSSSVEFFYTNGTQIFMVPWAALAIGNWTLTTELFEATTSPTATLTETATDWIITQLPPSGSDTITQELRFSKTDGVLNYYDSTITSISDEIVSSVRIVRDGYSPSIFGGLDPTLLLMIGAGAAIVVIVVVIIMKKK
jgi:hypothetical protein